MAVIEKQIGKEAFEAISKAFGKKVAEQAEKEGMESAFKTYSKEVGEKKAKETWGDILKYRVRSSSFKKAALTVGGGVVAGKYMIYDKGLLQQASELAFGQKGTKKISDTASKTADKVKETAHEMKDTLTSMTHPHSGSPRQSVVQGIPYVPSGGGSAPAVGSYIGGAVGNAVGNGVSTAGGFISNLSHGNVSSMSLLELIASSYMCFGRFGLLTKALGALIAGMTLRNNSQTPSYEQNLSAQQPEQMQTQNKGIHA